MPLRLTLGTLSRMMDQEPGTEVESSGPTDGNEVPPQPISVSSSYVPRKSGDILELDMEDGLILYNHDSSLVHYLNPSARIVWHLCDGSASIEALARDIAQEYGQDEGAVVEQVAILAGELDALGLIEDEGTT